MSSLWLGPKSFIRVVGRSRSPVTRGAPAKEENLHEHLTQFPFSNPGAGELRDYLRLRHPPAARSNSCTCGRSNSSGQGESIMHRVMSLERCARRPPTTGRLQPVHERPFVVIDLFFDATGLATLFVNTGPTIGQAPQSQRHTTVDGEAG